MLIEFFFPVKLKKSLLEIAGLGAIFIAIAWNPLQIFLSCI